MAAARATGALSSGSSDPEIGTCSTCGVSMVLWEPGRRLCERCHRASRVKTPLFPFSKSLARRSADLDRTLKLRKEVGTLPPGAAYGLPDSKLRRSEKQCKKTNEPKRRDF